MNQEDSMRFGFRSLALSSTVVGSLLGGCGFSPEATQTELQNTGNAGTTGHVTGTGGTTSGRGGSTGTGSGGSIGTAGTGGGMTCGQTNVMIATLPPDILIVEDKSGSMDRNASGNKCSTAGCTKWSQVSTAVENVVMSTQANVNWGLKFFANDSSCGITAGAAVKVAPNNYTPIQKAFSGASPGGSTPTETAIDSAAAYLGTLTDPNPKFLLLATDGLPNCMPGNTDNMADDSAGAEAAVTRAFKAGFPTFVVGIATASDQMATNTLNTMAMNGGYAQTGAATSYYSVADTASLEAALNKIVGLVASCTMPLNGAPTNFSNVAVQVQSTSGAMAVPQDPSHANGWDYTNNKTSVEFYGPACDSLKSGAYKNVQFIYACPGSQIIIG
jgi:hypothetical protein